MNTADQARDEALADVRDHAAREWVHYAELALHAICFTNETFTSAMVWNVLRARHPFVKTSDPRAMGAVMKRASGNWCEPTDRTAPSDNRVSHGRRLTIWRSLVR